MKTLEAGYWIMLKIIVRIIAPAINPKITCDQLILRRDLFCVWTFFFFFAIPCSVGDDTTL